MPELSLLDAFVAMLVIWGLRWLLFTRAEPQQGTRSTATDAERSAPRKTPVGPSPSAEATILAAKLGISSALPRGIVTMATEGILLQRKVSKDSSKLCFEVEHDAVRMVAILNQVADLHLVSSAEDENQQEAIAVAFQKAGVTEASKSVQPTGMTNEVSIMQGGSPARSYKRPLCDDVAKYGWLQKERKVGTDEKEIVAGLLVSPIKEAAPSLYMRPAMIPQHKLLFSATQIGKLAMLRQLKPSLHIDISRSFIEEYAPYALRQIHIVEGSSIPKPQTSPSKGAQSGSSLKQNSWSAAGRTWLVKTSDI